MSLDIAIALLVVAGLLAGAILLGRAAWQARQRASSSEPAIRRGQARVIHPDTELR